MAHPIIRVPPYNLYLVGISTSIGNLPEGGSELREEYIVEQDGWVDPEEPTSTFARAYFPEQQDLAESLRIMLLPIWGMVYWQWNLSTSPMHWPMKLQRIDVTAEPAMAGKARVILYWRTMYTIDPCRIRAAAEGFPLFYDHYYLPMSVEYTPSGRDALIFRRDWTTPPLATLDISVSDIGGTAAILGSKDGFPIEVNQTKIRARLVKDSSVIKKIDAAVYFSLFTGKKNSDIFMGFPIGSLVCDGISIVDLSGEFYELVFDATFDQYYHHSQVATILADQLPATNSTGTELADVKWQRVKRDAVNFNEIFFQTALGTWPDHHRLYAEKGSWVIPCAPLEGDFRIYDPLNLAEYDTDGNVIGFGEVTTDTIVPDYTVSGRKAE